MGEKTLRHDAFRNLDVMAEKGPAAPIRGLQVPLPVLGPYSPSVLAFRMLAKGSVVFGGYLLALRLLYLVSPDVARFGASALAGVFAVALLVHWFTPGRGMPAWPVWVGFALLVLFGASSFLPSLGLLIDFPRQGSLPDLVGPLLQAGVLVLILVHFLLPVVKRITSSFSRGPLFVGFIAAVFGGKFATGGYYPESDFSAWVTFGVVVFCAGPYLYCVADQYARFQEAMHPDRRARKLQGWEKWVGEWLPLKFSYATPLLLLVPLWAGNFVFVDHIGSPLANVLGLVAFLFLLALWTFLQTCEDPLRPYRAAWAALTFFLTYNLQRNPNPNAYQLSRIFREPLVRHALVAFASGTLSVGLLHLSGVQAAPGSNQARLSQNPLLNSFLPQSYIGEGRELNEVSRAIYRRHAEKLAAEGDAPLPAATPCRSLAGLAFRAILFFAGGPLLFFFLLATTHGHFLIEKEGSPEGG